ncbi:MAG: hypothetical protein HOH37_07030 [Gammaproteobacteria bacterium]|jgi:uncharacterized Zn finger protein|nr:hypothetical protein [Gammaproteobacteria bacterium]
MKELTLLVKGSSADPYELTFIKDGASLTALCNCPAGTFGNLCKHRVAALDGDGTAVVDDDAGKLNQVMAWLAGTDVEAALAALRDVEASNAATKLDLTEAKRMLSKTMNS